MIINKSNKKFMENFVVLNDPLPAISFAVNCLKNLVSLVNKL